MRRAEALRILMAEADAWRGLGVRTLSIFGSTARDAATPDSDVDIFVEFEGPATLDRYVDLKSFLESRLGVRVDLLTKGAVPPRLRAVIEAEAVRVA